MADDKDKKGDEGVKAPEVVPPSTAAAPRVKPLPEHVQKRLAEQAAQAKEVEEREKKYRRHLVYTELGMLLAEVIMALKKGCKYDASTGELLVPKD